MADLAVLDMAAGLDDLEPAKVAQGLVGALERGLDRVLDAGGRGSDELYHLVDVFRHGSSPLSLA